MAESHLRHRLLQVSRSLQVGVLTVAALACMVLWPADDIYASCGDYVHVNGVHASGPTSGTSAYGGDLLVLNEEGRQPHPPCSGPNCSRLPQRMPTAPAVPMTTLAKDWAGTAPDPFNFELSDGRSFEGQLSVHPIYCSTPPDRPPR